MDQLRGILANIQNRIEKIEKGLIIKIITIPADGAFVPKVVTSDPTTPKANEVWIRSDTKQLSWNDAGTVRRVTLT